MDDKEFDFKKLYKKGDVIYYLRIIVNLGINEIIESKLRTVENDYMVASGAKDKQAIYIGRVAKDFVFTDRKLALKESKKHHVRKVTKEVNNINKEEEYNE